MYSWRWWGWIWLRLNSPFDREICTFLSARVIFWASQPPTPVRTRKPSTPYTSVWRCRWWWCQAGEFVKKLRMLVWCLDPEKHILRPYLDLYWVWQFRFGFWFDNWDLLRGWFQLTQFGSRSAHFRSNNQLNWTKLWNQPFTISLGCSRNFFQK